MVAVYIRKRWPGALSDTVLALADVEPRGEEYGERKGVFTGWFVWLIVRAWVQGLVKRKSS